MVKLAGEKQRTEGAAIERMPLPARVYIPLSQHIGKSCLPQVLPGDIVQRGQKIASVDAHVFAPVHSSISGKVLAIQEWPHPVLGRARAVVIDRDTGVKEPQFSLRSPESVASLTPDQIREIIKEAGIVGMGGASFPTFVKLTPPKPVDTLIINGAECEPYLTGDHRLMLEKTVEIIKGVELITRCVNLKKVIIAIEDNKPDANNAFNKALEALHFETFGKAASCHCEEGEARRSNLVSGNDSGVSLPLSHCKLCAVHKLKSEYPQGGEKQLIKEVTGKEVPRGKLPFELGILMQNVSTVFAIYEAVYWGKPLYERVVTVTGSCISNPKNLLARLGTPIKELIDFCGPLKFEPAKIVIGGPMMGLAQFTTDVPVIKSTTAVMLLAKDEVKTFDEESCIRCGACVRECPCGLMPCLINLASEKELWQQAKIYGAGDCVECGVCNYVCPANRRLVQSIKRAKVGIK